MITDPDHIPALAEVVGRASRVAVDTETHAATTFVSDGMWSALRVISLAVRNPDGTYEKFVIDMRDVPADRIAAVMATIEVADAWNANFDDRVLQLAGCNVGSWRDAMFTDGLLHSGMAGFEFWHSLSFAARKYLGIEMDGKGTTQTSYDATSDLTEEQIAYAADDALITLWVAEVVDELAAKHGLDVPVQKEQDARPFILEMSERGVEFQMERWREVLAGYQNSKAAALLEIAKLTGGAEMTLFGESDNPTWNPDSDPQVRDALNQWATDAVKDFTGGRLLTRTDKLDRTTLKQIAHPLCGQLLDYRAHTKMLSTYGENLTKFVADDNRIRPRYRQGGVVATGRLASDRPNAQNFSPLQKPYFRPSPQTRADGTQILRAYVYADLSQVELRVLAEISGDERMRELFRLGGDFHANTAADMFQIDMDKLAEENPALWGTTRKKAKGVNFGIPYGLGAASLAQDLTVNGGVKTEVSEAADMLTAYGKSYPKVDKLLTDRDKYVRQVAKDTASVDWDLSFRCFELHSAAAPAVKAMKRRMRRAPSMEEVSQEILSDTALAETLDSTTDEEQLAVARAQHVADIRWALTFDRPVVLTHEGAPWAFESRTLTGRRRLFTVAMDSSTKDKFEGLITSAMLTICTSDNPVIDQLRHEFAQNHGLQLPEGTDRCPKRSGERAKAYRARTSQFRRDERTRCVKEFEGQNKPLKYELLKFVLDRMGRDVVYSFLLPMAFEDQVRGMGNRFRNHPIQSLVADIGLEYYADLHERLPRYRNAFPVQAVHDSITIECDLSEAVALCAEVKEALESALSRWCPSVPAVADADIRLSFDDEDVITEQQVEQRLAEPAAV